MQAFASWRLRWQSCSFQRSFYSSKAATQLDQLHHLAAAVNQTQSTTEKRALLNRFPGCNPILKRIYDPHLRLFISSKSVRRHIDRLQASDKVPTTSAYTLTELLDALSSRRLSGHAALDAAAAFFLTHCDTEARQQIFWRVLDRNLKMGVSVQTVSRIMPNENDDPLDRRKKHPFTVALAHAIHPGEECKLWSAQYRQHDWYASRKLDGVRCLAVITRGNACNDHDIRFYSRTGREFNSLQKVEANIRDRLTAVEENDIVLDGEICVYPSPHDTTREDFLTAVRQIRNRQHPMENPVYQVFDLIPRHGFREGADSTLFCDRQARLAAFIGDSLPHLRRVTQVKLQSMEDLKSIVENSIINGWEGLIVRNNTPYEGKRNRNMVKIKQWEDAEYTVQDIETGLMRMPDTGKNECVMTSVLIKHKGNTVNVGSGFSLRQRQLYAQDPELIKGKPITVRYFSESITENGLPSLRFPSVKAVYEEGKRDT
ncbi:uncharacterized protein BYT42DRAFT_309801 [Radiomyces spectabilis]|uniref:uncharacterized protein n=1 Tax=Radiomyces spectabilis TaxID=64574 RepID=UPI00221F4BF0|nr:uncharacterized protein BYT42DRAFT_309801 [Radiomyces spectabilis]KAI8381570.1 hypothetical protein BYT42DRAFT_309801 [Radiomyces spectabilis]